MTCVYDSFIGALKCFGIKLGLGLSAIGIMIALFLFLAWFNSRK